MRKPRIRTASLTTTLLTVVFSILVGWMVAEHRTTAVQAADIASGIGAVLAVLGAFYVLRRQLNYSFLWPGTRWTHRNHIQWLAMTISDAVVTLAGSAGKGGARNDALVRVHLATNSLPGVPPSALDEHIAVSQESVDEINRFKRNTERVTKRGALDDARHNYQQNLFNAIGLLAVKGGYELGGHGYVTDIWERSLMDWVMCATKLHASLNSPLSQPLAEDQLLGLLARLNSPDFEENATKSLNAGDMIRIRYPTTNGWSDTLKLTANPEMIDRHGSEIPIWELQIVDAQGNKSTIHADPTGFEPAPIA